MPSFKKSLFAMSTVGLALVATAGLSASSASAALEAPPVVLSATPQPNEPGWSTDFAGVPSELLQQGNGQQPIAAAGAAVYSVASTQRPSRVARSESDWDRTKSGASLKAFAGDRVRASYVVQPRLGDSPMDDSGWVVVTQAQGPVGTVGTQQWIEPGFALAIRNGHWIMTGGDWGRGNQWYNLNLKRYVDGQPVRVRFDVLLGAGGAGAVKLWLDDRLVVDRTGVTTIQPDAWDGMRLRTGLYVGEQTDAPAPGYARSVAVRNLSLSVARGG